MMKFLRLNQCTWLHITIGYHATYSGNIELMDWVQQQGCVFKTVSMKIAAKRCDLRMLQNLCDANCGHKRAHYRIHYTAMSAVAAECGYLTILQLALQHIEQPQLTELLNIAGRKGEPIVAKWLRQQGAEWPATDIISGEDSWRTCTAAWAISEGYKCIVPQL
jgi:hypothetical protein